MIQEIIALAVILLFILRLGLQLYKDQISKSQFVFWLAFWAIAGFLIIFIRKVDQLAADLGFSSSGIQFLFYLAVALLFYWIFKLRLKIEKMNRDITELARTAALRSARKQ
jgi:hypothetical protein